VVVTLPETLSGESLAALAETLRSDAPHRVLRGADGESFCQGLSLEAPPDDQAVERFVACVRALRCGPPAIAVVEGAARGAGVGLAAACDRVIATPSARFALSELLFGLVPSAIWPLLAERVSAAKLRWWALTGATLDAEAARAIGLVDEVTEAPVDLEATLAPLRRVSAAAVQALKSTTAPMGAVAIGAERTRARLETTEVRERIARFLDGGAPWD